MIQHQWKSKPTNSDSSYEERECPVCRLQDRRATKKSLFTDHTNWSVKTPCIKPVPERVEFDELIAELKAHPAEVQVDHGIRRTMSFEDHVFCIGRPGKWRVGLGFFDGLFPDGYGVTHKTLEEANASLLRWMRARQYNPYLYSGLYRMQESDRIKRQDEAALSD